MCALLVSDIVTRVRDQHASFARQRVTDAVIVRGLSTFQGQLMTKALLRDRAYLAQSASIFFSGQSTSGAATGGFPAALANDGTVSRERQPTGYAKDLDLDTGVILVAEFVPSSSTTTTVVKTSAGWTTDAYQSMYLEVVAGTGVDQRRVIASNTSDTLTWTTALTTALDSTSVVRVVSVASSVDQDLSVVTAMPATDTREGYLIKLDANGVAYIDLTDPLVATFDRGIPLPKYKHILGGTVHFESSSDYCELTLGDFGSRDDMLGDYCAYIAGRELFLMGDSTDWDQVESIDLRYVPEPPRLAQLTDYFLLPDHAEDVLVAQGAMIAGARVQGLEGMAMPDMTYLMAQRDRAESAFLSEVAAGARAQGIQRLRESW